MLLRISKKPLRIAFSNIRCIVIPMVLIDKNIITFAPNFYWNENEAELGQIEEAEQQSTFAIES
ncbi:hypothetical protein BIW11_10673, partial [Tropilaelaps mercedesae]